MTFYLHQPPDGWVARYFFGELNETIRVFGYEGKKSWTGGRVWAANDDGILAGAADFTADTRQEMEVQVDRHIPQGREVALVIRGGYYELPDGSREPDAPVVCCLSLGIFYHENLSTLHLDTSFENIGENWRAIWDHLPMGILPGVVPTWERLPQVERPTVWERLLVD